MADEAPASTPEAASDGGGDFAAAVAAAEADGAAAPADVEDVQATETPADDAAPAGDVEAKADEAPPKPKKDDDSKPEPQRLREKIEEETRHKLRGDFTALARDRKKLREREATLAAKEQQLGVVGQKAQAYDTLVTRLRTDPAALVMEAGGDELVNKLLEGIAGSTKSPAERRVAEMEAELKRRDEAAKQAEQAQTVERWKTAVRDNVTAAADKFDLVNSLGQHDAVIATIEAYYVKYPGQVLPIEDAAQAVEDLLAAGLKKSKKFGERAPVNNAQPGNKAQPAASVRRGGSTTLSSVHSSEVPSSDEDDLPLDPRERFQRVLAGLS